MQKKHYLVSVIDSVEATHPGLGELVALELLTVKAGKFLLCIGAHGTGKSVASSFINKHAPASVTIDRLSVAGLASISEELSDFKGSIIVDDIAKSQTVYARTSTVTSIAELVYSHGVSSHMSKLHFEIKNFNGSAIVNIQPVLLRQLSTSPEWEASIADKSIRYYHLRRPLFPVLEPPDLKIKWGLDLEQVKTPNLDNKPFNSALSAYGGHWTHGRRKEHITDLLKAAAAFDSRATAGRLDIELVTRLLKPLLIEQLVMEKQDFEAKRELKNNKLAILTEFFSYGNFTLDQLALDYGVSKKQAYKLMKQLNDDWEIKGAKPITYGLSEKLEARLFAAGLLEAKNQKPKGARA
jgi:hypothetical protein|tara:strand:- start:6938 stop:7996 length:1059 start_codon:yes stop_codon:yes gene_type:complete